MTESSLPPSAEDAASPVAMSRQMFESGWQRWVFPGVWLVYLAQTAYGVSKHATGVGALAGYLIIVAFAGCYLCAIATRWASDRRTFWMIYAAALVLTAVETIFAHEDAFVFCVYLAVLTVAEAGRRAPLIIGVLALAGTYTPRLVTSWGAHVEYASGLTIVLVSLAMHGFFSLVHSNIELDEARAEVARLAAENERSRIARDLHDLLGHSLTTITVKAGLARRLAEHGEIERAAREVTEVEELSRRTLGEVRAAVSGYRDVTLGSELANAREVLRSAGIQLTLPGAVDLVDDDASELFGWVVREAITNVVRHSRATRCTITLGARWIEITDDGRGGVGGAGNGLCGLSERVAAAGGSVDAQGSPSGWRVRAELAAATIVPEGADTSSRR